MPIHGEEAAGVPIIGVDALLRLVEVIGAICGRGHEHDGGEDPCRLPLTPTLCRSEIRRRWSGRVPVLVDHTAEDTGA